MTNRKCPLCLSGDLKEIKSNRVYYRCVLCGLIFAHSKHYLPEKEEKKRYKEHENSIDNKGYVDFLNRAVIPSFKFIKRGMRGIDYGCGFSPVLYLLLKEKGIKCGNYDPLFLKKKLKGPRDFIFSTETFEHFKNPRDEIKKIKRLLKEGGYLIIMTERYTAVKRFKDWYYTRDLTHISFYNRKTFDYIRAAFGFEKVYDDKKRVIILKKIKRRNKNGS